MAVPKRPYATSHLRPTASDSEPMMGEMMMARAFSTWVRPYSLAPSNVLGKQGGD
jgi:hypothetical protein